MKTVKVILGIIILYFCLTAINGIHRLVYWASGDNVYIQYGLYGVLIILGIIYLLVPILDYMNRPSLLEVEKAMSKDPKAIRRVRRHLLNTLEDEDLESLKTLDKKDVEGIKDWVQNFMIRETDGYDKVIRTYAYKLTSTVLLSPNAFIDGLAILYGNSNMIYELTKRTKFRYTTRELFGMYFSVLSIASVSGIVEEFDDELEEIIKNVAEEFSNAISEETGRSVGDTIPFLNVAVRASSILFQAAGNYAFIMYNGKRFKYRVRNAVDYSKKTENEIRKQARKEARRSRYLYVQEMIKKMGVTGASTFKDLVSGKMGKPRSSSNSSEGEAIFDDLDEDILSERKGFFGFIPFGQGRKVK